MMSPVLPVKERPPIDFLKGAQAVYRMALPMSFWSKRTLFMSLLGATLPLTALIFLMVKAVPAFEVRVPGYIFYSNAFTFVHYYILLTALFYGTAVVAEEIEGNTLTYLFSRPVPKPAILIGKAAAAWTVGAAILAPLLFVTFSLFTLVDGLIYSGGISNFTINLPTLLEDVALALAALAVYVALFTFIGSFFNRPVMVGIVIAFVWETWVAFIPGVTRKLTVMHYVQSLTSHSTGKNIAISILGQATPTYQAIGSLILIFGLFTALAIWTFKSREYIFDLSKR